MAARVLHLLIIPVAAVVALATGLGITSLGDHADRARVAQVAFADARAELGEEHSLELEARATGHVSTPTLEARKAIKARLRGELRKLSVIDSAHASGHARLRVLVATFESALDSEFRHFRQGDIKRAEVVDETQVDPAYERLQRELRTVDRAEGAAAVETLQRTKLSVFLSLGGALLALLILFWRFRRTERAADRTQEVILQHEASHDHLTGLPNRRQLMADLELESGRRLLLFFDLDGFKAYNDSFGHVEGDLLLERLGRKLARAVAGCGVAYRLGGDEFCVLAEIHPDAEDRAGHALEADCAQALRESGEGFRVEASRGRVVMPDEAAGGSAALIVADQRMYADKGAGRASARQQTRDLVLRVLAERHPAIHRHANEVAALACLTGERMGLDGPELDELERAAELHDIGKIAIPDAILDKPSALDDDEWRFMRRHTLIGENMLGAAPALASVAKVVRWSHERFDGGGYPDRLAGEAIPLASRIVFVCDAYHAMTAERPYATGMSGASAVAELVRCGGTQFDPSVVAAFRAAQAAPAATSAAAA